jgi:hypothetical protein
MDSIRLQQRCAAHIGRAAAGVHQHRQLRRGYDGRCRQDVCIGDEQIAVTHNEPGAPESETRALQGIEGSNGQD